MSQQEDDDFQPSHYRPERHKLNARKPQKPHELPDHNRLFVIVMITLAILGGAYALFGPHQPITETQASATANPGAA